MHPVTCAHSHNRPATPIGNVLIEGAPKLRRSARARVMRGAMPHASAYHAAHKLGTSSQANVRRFICRPSIKRPCGSTPPIVASEDSGGRLGNYVDPVAEPGVFRSCQPRRQFQQQKVAYAGIVDTRFANSVYAGPTIRRATRRMRSTCPQSLGLGASSTIGYRSVPSGRAHAPGVSFAGSILSSPMMCITETPCVSR